MSFDTAPFPRMGIALVALAGFFVSAYLTLYHLGGVGQLQCGLAGGCDVVQGSEYAYFAGIPVAGWGVAGYVLLFALAMLGIRPERLSDRRIGMALLGLASVAVLFSTYLTYLEAAVIRAWCQWCVVSAILVVLIFLFSITDVLRLRRSGASHTG